MVKRYAALLVTLNTLSAFGDPFRNLNFEQALTNALFPDTRVANGWDGFVTDLIPGWQLFQDTNELKTVGYNLDLRVVADNGGGPLLIGLGPPNSANQPLPLEGSFSFGILSEGWSLVQRGDIPADARFLTFSFGGNVPFVRLDGMTLLAPQPAVGFLSPISLDISPFAGKNVELTFGGTTPAFEIDSIAFVVPEPSTTALTALGVLAFLARRFWRRKPGG